MQLLRNRFLILLVLAVLTVLVCAPTRAEDAPKPPDFRKGALHGRVVDAATGAPVAGAVVALRDRDGKVLAWTKTDAQGTWTMAADAMKALNLRPSRRRGLLDQIVRGIGEVAKLPVKAATETVKVVGQAVADPAGTVRAAAVTAVTGSPAPAVAQLSGLSPEKLKEDAEKRTRENAAKAINGERQAAPKEKRESLAPGEVFLAVSAPSYKEAKGKAGACWLEPLPVEKDGPPAPCAWMETVRLAPAASDKNSEIVNEAVLLSEPHLEPTLVPAGGTVKLRVKLTTPAGPPYHVRVFAREDRKRAVAELKPGEGGVYAGELALDPKTSAGDTTITLVAMRAEPLEVKLPKGKADPLAEFVRRLDDLDPDKPYEFDPRLMASENRLDLALTVLDPKQGTPAGAQPAPPGAPEKK